MTILAEPLTPRRREVANYFRQLRELVDGGQGCTETIVIGEQSQKQPPIGSRYLFDHGGELATQLGNGTPADALAGLVKPLDRRPGPSVQHGIAYLPILPRITLLIVGGGHVGQAVAKLAADVDFDVWVLDDRERYASRERFPTAKRLLVGEIGNTLKQV